MIRWAPLLLLLLQPSATLAEPTLGVVEDRFIQLSGLPQLLDKEEIRDHIGSGLTVTLAFRLTERGRSSDEILGAAALEIRYELWDEQYLLRILDADSPPRSETLDSEKALLAFWSGLGLRLTDLDAMKTTPSGRVVLSLEVIPFSHSEQIDTQRWFSESVHRNSRSAGDGARVLDQQGAALERVFRVLMATSIQRRPLDSFDWPLVWPDIGSHAP